MHEFDDVVFSVDTPMDTWVEPFAVGHHYETVKISARQDDGPYDAKNLNQMKDRLFNDWLTSAKTSPEVIRQLAPPERQWALDRASRGVFTTEVPRDLLNKAVQDLKNSGFAKGMTDTSKLLETP